MAENAPVSISLVVAGGFPVLQVSLVSALQADRRLRLAAHTSRPNLNAASDVAVTSDVIVLVTAAALPAVLRLQERLQGRSAKPPFLLLREHADRDDVLAAVRAGLPGYGILSLLAPGDLASGIVLLAHYGTWLCPLTTRILLGCEPQEYSRVSTSSPSLPRGAIPHLSERELAVLRVGAAGMRDAEIAEHLCLTPNTVKTYWRRIREKLRVTTRAETIAQSVQFGLIPDRRGHLPIPTDRLPLAVVPDRQQPPTGAPGA